MAHARTKAARVPPVVSKDAGAEDARLADDPLFEHGPPNGFQLRLGLIGERQFNVGRRAILAVIIGWAPLMVLAALQSVASQAGETAALLQDAGVHARYLLAAPLLILAEAECAERLSAIVRHFADAGLVTAKDRGRYDAAVASTRRLLKSNAAEIAVAVLAVLSVIATVSSVPFEQFPAWHVTGGTPPAFSLAGWWHVVVSLPLLVVLLLAWAWRFFLWVRLLWTISRLDLHLIASHPDRSAGLGFLGYSLRAFAIVAFALATIIAGRSARIVLLGGTLPTQYFVPTGIMLLAIVALLAAPLLIFVPVLMKTWRHGALKYGALANQVGTAFENKWLGIGANAVIDRREEPDFSPTSNLYSIVANVYALRLIPTEFRSVSILCGAALLPFLPVVLMTSSSEQILAGLRALIF